MINYTDMARTVNTFANDCAASDNGMALVATFTIADLAAIFEANDVASESEALVWAMNYARDHRA